MDDGSFLTKLNKDGTVYKLIRIASFSFTPKENKALITMLQERFEIEAHIWKQPNKRKPKSPYKGIWMSKGEAEKFLSITHPYLEPTCMAHKWGLRELSTE